jgi:hypothetical protein
MPRLKFQHKMALASVGPFSQRGALIALKRASPSDHAEIVAKVVSEYADSRNGDEGDEAAAEESDRLSAMPLEEVLKRF